MAKVFMESTDTGFIISNNNTYIYGASGIENISIINGVTGLVFDQNIDHVTFPSSMTSYTYQQAGNTLKVYSGSLLVASVPVQGDPDGTLITFTDSNVSATLVAGVMKLGDTVIGSSGTTDLHDLAELKSVHINTVENIADTGDSIVQTLASGSYWQTDSLTYTFNTTIPSEYIGDSSLTTGWAPLSALQQTIAQDVFASVQELTGLQFTKTASNGDIRFNIVDMDSSISGFAYYPSGSTFGGDVFISSSNSSEYSQQPGDFGYMVFWHELGHALGLKHPFEGTPVLQSSEDNIVHTVMSYTSWKNYVPSFTYSSEGVSFVDEMIAFPSDYTLYDVAALQAVYGYNQTTRTGSDTYSVSYDNHEYRVIWDAGGTDLINAGDATFLCSIDLRPGAFSSVNMHSLQVQEAATVQMYQQAGYAWAESWVHGVYSDTSRTGSWYTGENNLAIGYGVIIENVTTGSGNDTIVDNQVDNIINSGAGNDAIQLTGAGFDYVDGGAGTDSVRLPVNSSAIQKGITSTGSWLVVGSSFAVELTGVEQLVYADGSSFTLTV